MNSTILLFQFALMAIMSAECDYPCTDAKILQISEDFFRDNIEYEFQHYPLPTRVTYTTLKGDCTSFVLFIEDVSRLYDINDVKAVHGYTKGNVKHDWIEHKGLRFEYPKQRDHVKVGDGIW